MDGNTQRTGFSALVDHCLENKVSVALWFTRGLTLMFSLLYMFPLFWYPSYYYYKALAAYAATSALRLHQRRPVMRPSYQTLAQIMMEDSCHYLMYSMIFFFVTPVTLALVPIMCFALIHFASYSLTLLDVLGPNSMWMARLVISLLEYNTRSVLSLIALTEILLMPLCLILVFNGNASFFTPIFYHQFITKRYNSMRNPSTKIMFTELSLTFTRWAHHKHCPSFVKNIILGGIEIVTWMCPTRPQVDEQAQQAQ